MAPHRHSSSRTYLERFVRQAAASVPAGAIVLDAGAGKAPYAPLFSQHRYETADFTAVDKTYAEQTYVCDLSSIPVEDGRFDLVLLSQVLEHIPAPPAVIAELARVLKPDGLLWLSAPLFYEEHEQPYDFYRYTQFGLGHLLADAGFVVERLDWLEGYFGTLGYQVRMAGNSLPARSEDFGGGFLGLGCAITARAARPLLRRLGRGLDRLDERHRYEGSGMPKNYAVVARRA